MLLMTVPLVPETGLEPVCPCGRQILNLQSIPFLHSGMSVFTGPAYRNRTHIRGVEIRCIIHYTNASVWCHGRELNPHFRHSIMSRGSALPIRLRWLMWIVAGSLFISTDCVNCSWL
jgi:hypothetical protein